MEVAELCLGWNATPNKRRETPPEETPEQELETDGSQPTAPPQHHLRLAMCQDIGLHIGLPPAEPGAAEAEPAEAAAEAAAEDGFWKDERKAIKMEAIDYENAAWDAMANPGGSSDATQDEEETAEKLLKIKKRGAMKILKRLGHASMWCYKENDCGFWQMVDAQYHNKLEKGWVDGDYEATITKGMKKCENFTYWVDLEGMTQTRWKGQEQGTTRDLKRVEMIKIPREVMHDARVLDGFDGFKFQWQYEVDFGWKNFEPTKNRELKTAQGEGLNMLITWDANNYWKVDFGTMKQTRITSRRAGQVHKTNQRVRLVALREFDSESSASSSE